MPTINPKFEGRKCELCGKEDHLLGVASLMFPMSVLMCRFCAFTGAQPLDALKEMCPNRSESREEIMYYNPETDEYRYYHNDEVFVWKFTDGQEATTRTEAVRIFEESYPEESKIPEQEE